MLFVRVAMLAALAVATVCVVTVNVTRLAVSRAFARNLTKCWSRRSDGNSGDSSYCCTVRLTVISCDMLAEVAVTFSM